MHPLPKPSRGHRHGAGAHRRGAAARALPTTRSTCSRTLIKRRGARDRLRATCDQPVAAGARRPHPRLLLPDRRRRDPRQRRPRLRAAPHHPPRHPPRLQARRAQSRSSTRWCPTWWPRWARPIPSLAASTGARDGGAEAGRGALLRDHRPWHGDPGSRTGRLHGRSRQRNDALQRRDRIQAARHLRLPARPDRRTCAASTA